MAQAQKKLALSGRGLANWPRGIYENDFAFILPDGRYECPLFIATFLSPRVAGLLSTDPTVRELQIRRRDPNHFFAGVLGLAEGCAIELTEENSEFVCFIGFELGNSEIMAAALGPIARDSVFARLRVLFEFNENVAAEIEFCSSHFHELDWAEFDRMPIEILQAILSHQSLKLRDEDSLFGLILSAVRLDARFAILFESI
jgi:hypothetical protein